MTQVSEDTTLSASHPFAGLRPFDFADRDFFFGRDEQKFALYRLLDRNRFVSVIGSSGSGKSSLVRAALLPLLQEESAEEGGTKWRFATMQPGDAPVDALRETLLSLAPGGGDFDRDILNERLGHALESSSFGLLNAVKEIPGLEGTRVLIVVDQFEEIFRFAEIESLRDRSAAASARDERAKQFVQLLLEATRSRTSPVSVLITMRSDFIGDCAQFQRLPEAVSAAQFLVPSLTRIQMEEVIRKPIEAAGATIETPLVERLLNDAARETDQLPVLQHCLSRLWEIGAPALANAHYDDPRIGGIRGALSKHADEILGDLPGLEWAVEQTFRALSKVDKEGRATRRALAFAELQAETGVPENDLRTVVDRFRSDDCTFLVPSKHRERQLKPDTRVDVVHEALLRRWEAISAQGTGWLWLEEQDARDYRFLLTFAGSVAAGERATLPREQYAALWQKWSARPRMSAWADRYGGQIGLVEQLFANSAAEIERQRREREAHEKAEREAALVSTQMAASRRLARRTGIFAALVSLVALVAIGLGIAFAKQTRDLSKANRDLNAAILTVSQKDKALTKQQRQLNADDKQLRLQQIALTKKNGLLAKQNVQLALLKTRAENKAQDAMAQRAVAMSEKSRADLTASQLQSVVQSVQLAGFDNTAFTDISSYDLRMAGMIAVDAFALSSTSDAESVLLDLAGMKDALMRVALPRWSMSGVVDRGSIIGVLAGAEQRSYRQPSTGTLVAVDASNGAVLSRFAPVHAELMCGFDTVPYTAVSTGSSIDIYSLAGAYGVTRVSSIRTGPVNALACSRASQRIVYAGGDGRLHVVDASGANRTISGPQFNDANGIVLSPSGNLAAVAGWNGEVSVFDLRSGLLAQKQLLHSQADCSPVDGCAGALAFSDDEKVFAYYDSGSVYLTDRYLHLPTGYSCPSASCSRPVLAFRDVSAPLVLGDGVLAYDTGKKSYQKQYGDRSMTHHAIYDPHYEMFASAWDPKASNRPNPYDGGLALHSFFNMAYPAMGEVSSSQWTQSFALKGHELLIAGTNGFITHDLDALRKDFDAQQALSYHTHVRDSADGKHAVSFDEVTGAVQVLDTRPEIPHVEHQFTIPRVPVTADANRYYQYKVELAYDPVSGVVTVLRHSGTSTPRKNFAELDRYTANGTLLERKTRAQLAAYAHVDPRTIVNFILSSRGKYIVLRRTTTVQDVILRSDGSIAGEALAIRGVSENERFAFAVRKGDTNMSLYHLPEWKPDAITPIPDTALFVTLAPNGRTLAYDDKGSVKVFDVVSRLKMSTAFPAPPDIETDGDRGLAFSADSRYLLLDYTSSANNSQIAVYAADPHLWSRTICLMAGRPLTRADYQPIAGSIPYVDGCAPYEHEMYR